MHLKDRILAIVLVLCLLAGVFFYSKYDTATISETDSGYSLFQKKETIYFWYADETMTDYINSAAVAFGEQYGVRVIPQLTAESEYIEAINHTSLYGEQMPDLFLISNDSLEKAYLAGLATEIHDVDQMVNTTYFPQAAISAITYKEKKVAYPIFYETSALLFNRTYLDEWASQQANKELEIVEEEDEFEQEEAVTSETLQIGRAHV